MTQHHLRSKPKDGSVCKRRTYVHIYKYAMFTNVQALTQMRKLAFAHMHIFYDIHINCIPTKNNKKFCNFMRNNL